MPGQNTDNPLASFGFHIVAAYNGKYYDVSYGNVYSGNDYLLDWEKASIAGFYKPEIDLNTVKAIGWDIIPDPADNKVHVKAKPSTGWTLGRVTQL